MPTTPHQHSSTEPPGIRRAVHSASVRLAAGAGLLTLGPAIAGVLAARSLGPDGRGELAVLLAASSVAGTVGLHGRDVELLAGSSRLGRAQLLRRATSAVVLEGGAAIGLCSLAIGLVSVLEAICIVLNAGATCLFLLVRASNVGSTRSGRAFLADAAGAVVVVLFAGICAVLEASAVWFVLGAAAALLSGVLVGFPRAADAKPPAVAAASDASNRRYAWLSRALQAAAFRFDRVVLAIFAGSSAAGLYAAAVPLAEMATILPLHLAQLTTVRLSRSQDDRAWYRHRETRAVLAASTLASVLVAASAPWLLDLVYGAEFADAADALRVLAAASVISVVWRFAEADLYGRSIARPAAIATAVGAAVVLAGTAVLSDRGPVAASWASLSGYTAAAVIVVAGGRRAVRHG